VRTTVRAGGPGRLRNRQTVDLREKIGRYTAEPMMDRRPGGYTTTKINQTRSTACLIFRNWARARRDRDTLAAITGKKAGFKSIGDTWADTTTAHGRLMLTVLGGLAEFERDLAAAAVKALDALLTYFADGQHWTRGRFIRYYDARERRCLVGALDHLSLQRVINAGAARVYLERALPDMRNRSLIGFNDRCRSFKQLRWLIDAARQLACNDIGRHRQWRTPTMREAGREPEYAAAKLEAAEATKRRLLAEIELERMARQAACDFRVTYILCPEPPSNYHVRKVFAAADDASTNQSNRERVLESLKG
jgi:hypothetical protein